MGDDDQLQNQIADIGVRFLKRTIGEVAQLREFLDSARAGSLDSLKQLERLGHKIHGSGAMFGFDELSERASEIERLASTGRSNDSKSLDRIEEALRALEVQVDKAARDSGVE
jgi:HPt (histidine-containing phosphotransfer) domain-containing protein